MSTVRKTAAGLFLLCALPGAAPVSLPVLRLTLPAGGEESWFGSPAVWDLDGDGSREIIAGRHGVLYVWQSRGTLAWRAPVVADASAADLGGPARQYAGPVVGDLDGDGDGNGDGEIAVAFGNQVAVYDHAGRLLPGWPRAFPGPQGEIRALAAADLDGDGRLEILAAKTGDGPATVAWRLDGTVAPGWPQSAGCGECHEFGGYNQTLGAADLDGDGRPEVVVPYDMAYIGIMRPTGLPYPAHPSFAGAGPYASSVPMFHDPALARQGWGADGSDRDEFTVSPPAFGDLDGDGAPEIILYSDREKAGEYVIRGNCLWALNPDMTRAEGFGKPLCSDSALYTGYADNIVQVAPAPALAQLAGDPRPEILAPSYDGRFRCYSPDGALLWTHAFDSAGPPFIGASEAVVGDLNEDGRSEVVFTTYSTALSTSHLILLDAAGKVLHRVPLAGRGAMGAPTLADVDGDGRIDIVVSLKDAVGKGLGGVQVWGVASAGAGLLPWPTGRGNFQRSGLGSAGAGTSRVALPPGRDGRPDGRPAGGPGHRFDGLGKRQVGPPGDGLWPRRLFRLIHPFRPPPADARTEGRGRD